MAFKKLKMAGLTVAVSAMMLFGSGVSAFAYTSDNIDTTGSAATETTAESTTETSSANTSETTDENSTDSADSDTDSTTSSSEGRVSGESESGVLTPTGNLSLQDNVSGTEAENMDFMTVTSKDGHTFYIVIDHNGTTDNVYFLNQVDESDLMALMTDDEKAAFETEDTEETEEVVTPSILTESDSETTENSEGSESSQTEAEEPARVNTNVVLGAVFGIIGLLCIGAYYFLKIRPKKGGSTLDEDLEFYDDEDYENEDDEEPEFETEMVDAAELPDREPDESQETDDPDIDSDEEKGEM